VNEDVFTTFLFNEAVALCVIEPLHFSSSHGASPGRLVAVRAYIESARIFVKQFGKQSGEAGSVNQYTCVYRLEFSLTCWR
jgi:hypothetical protein